MKKKPQRLLIEHLEDRTLPATWGVAWPEAERLKVSFAPDGTNVDNAPSGLFQLFNSQAATRAWQTEILRALQTWAVNANINLGLVADNGQALGSAGPAQGSSAFGDIRLSARPLGADVLGLTAPYDATTGTRSGDVVFNSTAGLGVAGQGQYDLFSLALHEVGHSFGLDSNLDAASVMYQYYNGVRTGLSTADVAALQALYGTRTPDPSEGAAGNNSLANATNLRVPEVAADVTTNGDADFYRYAIPNHADRTVTFTVQTSGLSLLTPRLTICNAAGQVVSTASSTDPFSGSVSITLNNIKRGTVLYLKVEGARSDVFGIGGYRLKINSGAVSQAQIRAIDATLDGNALNLVTDDHHTNDTLTAATNLNQLIYQVDQRYDYSVNGGLSDVTDLDYYKVVAPAATAAGPQTLVATVARTGTSTLDPELVVYDALGHEVHAEVLANDDGSYAVQVVGATPGATYFLLVRSDEFTGNTANLTGNYLLGINFQDKPIVLETYVQGCLSDASQVDVFALQVNQSRVVELVLSTTTGDLGGTGGVQTAVRLNIYDALGAVVASLTCQDGNTVSQSFYLAQGSYTMRFVAATKDGSALPEVFYTLEGRVLTGPEDPPPLDPTLDPTQLPPPPPPPIVVTNPPLPPPLPPLDPSSDPWAPPPPLPPPPLPG